MSRVVKKPGMGLTKVGRGAEPSYKPVLAGALAKLVQEESKFYVMYEAASEHNPKNGRSQLNSPS
jgi:hypothetical protein